MNLEKEIKAHNLLATAKPNMIIPMSSKILISDAIRIAKEYAVSKCKEQKEMCITAYETWFNNGVADDRSAEEALAQTKIATDKDGEEKQQ